MSLSKLVKQKKLAAMVAAGIFIGSSGVAQAATMEQLQDDYLDQKFGFFIHYNMSTFTDQEWASQVDPTLFNPVGLDTVQWVKAGKSAGMQYAMLTAKHHDGFCLWDSAYTEYDIAAPGGCNIDIVQEYVDACRAEGVKVGLYFSIWDLNRDLVTGTPTVMDVPFLKNQITELLTQYGHIDYFWFDGMHGYSGTPWFTVVAEFREHIRALSPQTLICVNNAYDVSDNLVDRGTDIAVYEKPAGPMLQQLINSNDPSEVCDTAQQYWFWKDRFSNPYKSAADLISDLQLYNQHKANFLLNIGPHKDGYIDDEGLALLEEIGEGAGLFAGRLPGAPFNPFPAHNSEDQTITPVIDWINGGGATSYKVYLGTGSNLTAQDLKATVTASEYDAGFLEKNTRYYVRVDAVNGTGTTTGEVWSFVTGERQTSPHTVTDRANEVILADPEIDLSSATATASSLFHPNYGPANLVDNNLSSIIHTANQSPSWVQITLPEDKNINWVKVFNRDLQNPDRLNNCRVRVLDAAGQSVWESSNVIADAFGGSVHHVPVLSGTGIAGRSVWVGLDSGEVNGEGDFYLTIAEIKLYGGDVIDEPNTPPEFILDPIQKANGQVGVAYYRTLDGEAYDADGDTLTYSKVSGPSWLNVAENGALTGTPSAGDSGLNSWIVLVNDGVSGSDQTTLQVAIAAATDITPPAIPSGLRADQVNRIMIDWVDNNESDFAGYTVYRTTTPGGGYVVLASGLMDSDYTDLSAVDGTIYYYAVSASDAAGNESEKSSEVAASILIVRQGIGPANTTDCVLWLDGDDLDGDYTAEGTAESGLSGTGVSTWADKSGAGNHAVQSDAAKQAQLTVHQVNGRNLVHFDGIDDMMLFPEITSARTIFWVLKEDVGTTDVRFLLGHSSSYEFHRGETAAGTIWHPLYTSGSILNGTTRLDGAVVDGTATGLPSDAFSIVSLTTTGSVAADQLTQDRDFVDRSWDGEIAEVILYETVLSSNEIAAVEAYLNAKWFSDSPQYVEFTSDDFESGWGNWESGGEDAFLSADQSQGSQSALIQDNSGVASSITMQHALDLDGYDALKIDFSFYSFSMDNDTEDFWVLVSNDGGATWNNVKSYVFGTDFVNDVWNLNEEVIVTQADLAFSDNMLIRFQCDASGNWDDIFIDDVVISGSAAGEVLDPALIGWWEFSEASSSSTTINTVDGSAGMLGGDALLSQGSLYLVNSGWVDVPSATMASQLNNEVTISIWAWGSSALPASTVLLRANDAAGERVLNIHLPWSNSSVFWDAPLGNRISFSSSEAEFEGVWTHWTFTKDAVNGSMAAYVNGAKVKEETSGNTDTLGGIASFVIGAMDTTGGNPYKGTIADLKVYNRVLTDQEIVDLATQPITELTR